jgi:hypothetical protein
MTSRPLSLAIVACLGAAVSGADITALRFTTEQQSLPAPLLRSAATDAYLVRMRTTYALDTLLKEKTTEYEKVRAVGTWVHSRWAHDGGNEPVKSDPISILEEAAAGKRFRCVEYASVLSASLNALGIPARVLGLMTADAATRPSGAGHVVVEAWLADRGKWMMLDPQWDAAATLRGVPLNAVEFQSALASRAADLRIDVRVDRPERYREWIAPYLFYFTLRFDQRVPPAGSRGQLILVPLGAPRIATFQRSHPIADPVFTSSTTAFYQTPRD